MDHVTELVIEEVKIKGGAKIITAAYLTPNKVMFNGLNYIGKGLRWMLECGSNNMSRAMRPRDIRTLWELWKVHVQDMDLAYKQSDSPRPVHEFKRAILLPHPTEMRKYKNLKVQRIASEWHDYAHVVMSRDSASGQEIYDMIDYSDVKEAQTIVEETMSMVIGTGEKTGEGEWDTGQKFPGLVELGTEVPRGDMGLLEFAEPSKTGTNSGLPDAPDTDESL